MNRREFLALLAVAPQATLSGRDGFKSYLPYLDPTQDTFECEREAQYIESQLTRLSETKSLPLAPEFKGGGALTQWIGSIDADTRFYVLADNIVRYEITRPGEYRVGHCKQVWRDKKLAEFAPIDETVARSKEPLFLDVTGHTLGNVASFGDQLLGGNSWWRARLDSATGIDVYGNNGIAAGDIDNDGQDEIYVCQQGGLPNRLYKVGRDGVFVDITERAGIGVLDDTTCALFADFRNIGLQDLVVLRGSGPLMFRNDGHGRFTLQPDAFQFATEPQGGFTGMAAADYNRDGKLDLYLCCYVYFQSEDQYRYPTPYHDAQNGPPNFLFRNTGERFDDVTVESGMSHNNNRFSFAPAWCDTNGDGWPDLYVANDFGRNNFYRNRGGKFRDEAAEAGIEDMGPGMSAAWFDYDGDGKPDLYVSNMWTAPGQRIVKDPAFKPSKAEPEAYRRHSKGNSLYRNRGDGTFESVEMAQGVAMGRWAWSADAFDFDNDGSPEIYVTAGMLTNASKADASSFFWRQVVSKTGAEYEAGWNAINELIREDYSWCGREPNVFYKRPKGASRYEDFSGVSGLDFAEDSRAFVVTDVDGDGNLDIILKNRLAPQIRVLRNNCGLGQKAVAFRLQGTKSNRDAIGAKLEVAGRVQWLSAGSGFLSQHTKALHFAMPADRATLRVTWPSGAIETHEVEAGYRYDITEGSNDVKRQPFRLRSNWPTVPVIARNAPEQADVWLLEPVPTPTRIAKPGLFVLRESDEDYALFRRYLLEYRTDLKPPFAMLIDEESRVRKLYAGIPSPQAVEADRVRRDPLPFPFTGDYYRQPRRNYFKLGAAFYNAGRPERAIPYLRETLRRNSSNWKALHAIARIELDRGNHHEAMEAYRAVLEVRPNYAPALVGAGEAAMAAGDLDMAEKFLSQADKSADAANQMGLLRVRQNRNADAKMWFERAIEIERDHSGAINNLGVLYMQTGKPNDAIAAFEFGIRQVPDDSQLYMNLGRVYVSVGQMDRARETMQRLLARKPDDAAARKALASLGSR